MKNILVLVTLMFGSNSALADQCGYVTKDVAKTAAKLIRLSALNKGRVLSLCQLCGDKAPTDVRVSVDSIKIEKTGDRDVPSKITINDNVFDLAYTYVAISPTVWVNLGVLSGCIPFIAVDGKKTTVTRVDASQYILESTTRSGQQKFIISAKY